MYIRGVNIQNVRSLVSCVWKIDAGEEPGWHVIIGDNGSGKSSFLRSIALALVGPVEAEALRQDWNAWLTRGSSTGQIEVRVHGNPVWDLGNGPGDSQPGEAAIASVVFQRQSSVMLDLGLNRGRTTGPPSPGRGWFSAGYGPFRRFSGGYKDADHIFQSRPRLAAHLSLFGEDVALSESLAWLQKLQFSKLEQHGSGTPLVDLITRFVNQPGFLPHGTRLDEVSSAGVWFCDGNGTRVAVQELSDGYRSILSMTFELLRQLTLAYPPERLFESGNAARVEVPGVVLVDEVDAHLHPTWQRRVGQWFHERFPRLQFIVSTHSPLICQAAVQGSIWRLPAPGAEATLERVRGLDLDRLLYGNVLDAYGTDLFGEDVSRSDVSRKLLSELALLNRKERLGTLTDEERARQLHLRAILPTAADKLPEAQRVPA
ncbi:AAA family ATPase [Longimicrobium sp.]|uniref:AAA family ATPase n=1 Tax=Longimicrobium sp. TaxID=2029185 RepID=UPI002E32869F|nr:AAA family ATPase [Longimicrobium sp.]HEX6041041.1 AAA family ATPase [Longimicrobium sp.]